MMNSLLCSAHDEAGLVDMRHSLHARMYNTPLGAVKWTGGFWGERFDVFRHISIWDMWNTWNDDEVSHGFHNFQVAAGDAKGIHQGPPFHDGDMYKWLEACAAVYAVTHDKQLDALMDQFIAEVAKAQREDGYIHTPVIIDERNQGIDSHRQQDTTVIGITVGNDKEKGAFASRLNFETYNLGHLMTAGIVHYRATGKKILLNCAIKAADFLYRFYQNSSDELARNAICPSHYMGVAEMYRTTGNPNYLKLATELIHIRDSVKKGEDHNQDRIPFRQQYEAMGHAVRANYLYAGVADLYAEKADCPFMQNLTSIWNDIADRKIYITGGCGALYDGVSPDGTTYDQPTIQQIHQAYGRAYQLPNETAHNEICAQVGQLLFSWRMLEETGDARYADMVENELYNGILSGISLDGKDYFYTEALRRNKDFPYVMRWPKHRQHYISCFCCPPNTLRTLCEAQEYAYSLRKDTLWVNLYGDNTLQTKDMSIRQESDYPYDGLVKLTVLKSNHLSTIRLRIPSWCTDYEVFRHSIPLSDRQLRQGYLEVKGPFKKGDTIILNLAMHPQLITANPLVEESKNQVAVKYGPIVYCLESQDLPASIRINQIILPAHIRLHPVKTEICGHHFLALEGLAMVAPPTDWKHTLYKPLQTTADRGLPNTKIRLIPYYAWDNRGIGDMSVWLPLSQ